MPDLPSGTVTFLFTDVEGSTRSWERHPEAVRRASERHDALLRGATTSTRGARLQDRRKQLIPGLQALLPVSSRSVFLGAWLAAVIPLAGCVRAYDLLIDNRTMTSLTMRVYSLEEDGKFSQFPDRIFTLPPNREFLLERAIVATGRGDRRLFEFRRGDEQMIDSFVLTYAELEASGGRITVPRALAAIPRAAPPVPGFVDSSTHETIQFIPLFPKDSAPSDSTAPQGN